MSYESEFYAITRSVEEDLRTLLAKMDRRDSEIDQEISILRGQIDELRGQIEELEEEKVEIDNVRNKMQDFDNV